MNRRAICRLAFGCRQGAPLNWKRPSLRPKIRKQGVCVSFDTQLSTSLESRLSPTYLQPISKSSQNSDSELGSIIF